MSSKTNVIFTKFGWRADVEYETANGLIRSRPFNPKLRSYKRFVDQIQSRTPAGFPVILPFWMEMGYRLLRLGIDHWVEFSHKSESTYIYIDLKNCKRFIVRVSGHKNNEEPGKYDMTVNLQDENLTVESVVNQIDKQTRGRLRVKK